MKTIRAQATYPVSEIETFARLEGYTDESQEGAIDFVSALIKNLITERIARHAIDRLATEKMAEVQAALDSKRAQIAQAVTVVVVDAE